MSFEIILKTDIKKDELNKAEYRQGFKSLYTMYRPNISKSKIDMYSNVKYLKAGEFYKIHYKDQRETRYIAAANLTFELIVSIYDFNTRNVFVYRIFRYSESVKKEMSKFVESLKKDRPNLEARIFGMQNNQDFYYVLNEIAEFLMANNINLTEIELFGNSMRHIAIDAKLGTSYNVLMEDRLYRPGELVNSMTMENFEASLRQDAVQKDAEQKK